MPVFTVLVRALVGAFLLSQRAESFMVAGFQRRPSKYPSTKLSMEGPSPDIPDQGDGFVPDDSDAGNVDVDTVALKEEIAALESDMKSKRAETQHLKDMLDMYSKSGYARKVAEMENMRRVRNNLNSSNKSSSIAGVLSEFLPAYEKMDSLSKYSEDPFGSKYSGLSLKTTFASMGVCEFTVDEGTPVDTSRVTVVDKEYSDIHPEGTVIRSDGIGLELDGNVLRRVNGVASLGVENQSSDEDEESEVGEAQ